MLYAYFLPPRKKISFSQSTVLKIIPENNLKLWITLDTNFEHPNEKRTC